MLSISLVAALLCSPPEVASGAPINYGSHTGTSVTYIDVTEDTTTGDSLPLFGPPVFSGNSVDFNPTGFDAETSGSGGMDDTGARLTFTVQAHAGDAIHNLSFSEVGDVTLSGAGTDITSAEVTASGTIAINKIDGVAVTPIVRPIALVFTPSGGTYGLASDGGGLPFFHTIWSGSLGLNVSQILISEGVPFALGATEVSVDLVNLLTARTESGTSSLINKQDFGGVSVTVNQPAQIPEPASALLAASGLLVGISGVTSRKTRLPAMKDRV